MKKISILLLLAVLTMASFELPVQAASQYSEKEHSKPSKPQGTTEEINTDAPDVKKPLPAVDNGGNANDSILKNVAGTNPFISILDGFDQIWSMNQPDWRDGTALTIPGENGEIAKYGDGPTVYFDGYKNDETKLVADKNTYVNEEIRDPETWTANMKYVEDVTKNRTDEEALAAYYDDQRDKIYSMMEAYGPLANTYVDLVNPITSVVRSTEDMNVVLEESTVEDQGQGMGQWEGSELSDALDLVHLIRFRNPSSSNPSKYFFSSPRPYRMNSNGEVKEVVDESGLPDWDTIGSGESTVKELPSGGKKEMGERHYQQYETNVEVIPALEYVKRKAEDGRGKDGAFPSGHTSASYLSTFGFAYATPERYAEFLTRAAQMGENRIVTGMHSPLDVIGARIQATAMTAYAYNLSENQEVLNKAYNNAGEVFGELAASKEMSLYEYAHTVTEDYTFESAYDEEKWEDHEANKAFYREKLTYGLPQTGVKGLDPVVPKGAEVLLETRQPYLTDEQRREVLYTTEIESGYPVIDESNGWGRIDLVTASDGYGAFSSNVTVNMDASKGRFNAHDWWRNDITGSGMLTKQGTGTLTLTGNNSYSGGTLLQGGTLEAASATAFGEGDLYVENGAVLVNVDEPLNLNGNLTMEAGNLDIAINNDQTQLNVDGLVYLDGGDLNMDLSNYEIDKDTTITLMTADKVEGKLDSVTADDYEISVTYDDNSVVAHIKAVDTSDPGTPDPEDPENPVDPKDPESPKDPEETEDPKDSENSKDSEKQASLTLIPDITDGEASIETDSLYQLAEQGELRIDLLDHNDSVNLAFTSDQIKWLKENHITIIIQLKNVSLQLAASNFTNGSEAATIQLERLDDIDHALSVVYEFEIKQGEKQLNTFDEKVTLTFSVVSDNVNDKDQVQLFYLNPELEEWEAIGGEWQDGKVMAQTDHFSSYTVFEQEAIEQQPVTDDGQKEQEVQEGQKLPETATTIYQYLLAGFLLLLSGVFFLFMRRRKA
ncbi:LPXTG-motif cell wall anchor domain-containing protein [Gracilibacillus orientalis]|uniref:LPXTG-motif cell wall anchor domain-containing protein n=1 Tax=Gracilibacillus orientalis TaxID=334253 RepID=A0A1I4QPK9_9BACI|nr:phosphatase PAP2 family protein [Gracilibacillus orientalis]SFM41984.1 LPXTG-motif cell wall anchor domain-containing protein [Gracilibacillus orientalis]